jgi:hypothetical protein
MVEKEKDENKCGKEESKKRILKVNSADLAESMTLVQKGSKPE